MPKITYGEMRSNAEKIADEAVKERVLRGVELLTEKLGPDWPDKIDLPSLDMASGFKCVLGQVFDGEKPTGKQISAANLAHGWHYDADDGDTDGYIVGVAILDGPLLDQGGPEDHGFYSRYSEYVHLQEAWEMVFGAVTVDA